MIAVAPNQNRNSHLPTVRAELLGRKITCMTNNTVINAIHEACTERKKITVSNYNVNSFNLSIQYSWFNDFLQNAEVSHCDGSGIIYALRMMGYKLPLEYRVSYSRLMPELLETCNKNNFSIFLLGAKPEILEQALSKTRQEYPNISIEGHHGYFPFDDDDSSQCIIDRINHFRPNILIVGMGMPIQEYWVQKYRSKIHVNAILPGGAVIDRLAGIVPDCPEFISNIGLEWFFRLMREPKRLMARYLLGNPAFLLQVALAKSQKKHTLPA